MSKLPGTFGAAAGAVSFALTGAFTSSALEGATSEVVAIFSTRSKRSMRESIPASVLSPIGNKMRPQMSSRIKRGAVAPRIWVKPSAAISAARERFALPILFA